MDNENYINIQGWMRTALGLTGNRLMVYAIVYGFSQDKGSSFSGGLKYIMDWCGCSKNTARRLLQSLTEEGYIERTDIGQNGCIVQTYRAKLTPTKFEGVTPPKIGDHPSQNWTGTPPKIAPININSKNINIDNKDISTSFNFLKALMDLGVTEEVARAWMQVRKHQRATNTKIAFDKIKSEIAKSGRPADDCIRTAVEKSWRGFQADWLPKAPLKSPLAGKTVTEYLKEKGLI